MIILGVVILDKAIILKIITFLFFNLPLIFSTILILMFVISSFREKPDSNKLKAASVGILSIIITSLVIMLLPNESLIDIKGLWIVRVMCVPIILFTIRDTVEGRENGIKVIGSFSFVIFIFGVIEKIMK